MHMHSSFFGHGMQFHVPSVYILVYAEEVLKYFPQHLSYVFLLLFHNMALNNPVFIPVRTLYNKYVLILSQKNILVPR